MVLSQALLGAVVSSGAADPPTWYVGIASHDFAGSETSLTLTSTGDGGTGDFSQYMDLEIVSYTRFSSGGAASGTLIVEPNGDTYDGSNYQTQRLNGNGSSSAGIGWAGYIIGEMEAPGSTSTANTFGAGVAQLFDINSGKWKQALGSSAGDLDGSGDVGFMTATWKDTGAITSLKFLGTGDQTFAAGSRIDVFGVKRATA